MARMFIANKKLLAKKKKNQQNETTINKKTIHNGGQTHIARINRLKCLHELKIQLDFNKKPSNAVHSNAIGIALPTRCMCIKAKPEERLNVVSYEARSLVSYALAHSLSECGCRVLCGWRVSKYHKRLVRYVRMFHLRVCYASKGKLYVYFFFLLLSKEISF